MYMYIAVQLRRGRGQERAAADRRQLSSDEWAIARRRRRTWFVLSRNNNRMRERALATSPQMEAHYRFLICVWLDI